MRDDDAVKPISLGTFADYVNTNGAERMRMIAQQRAWYSGNDGPAFLPYQAARDGIRKAVKEGGPTPLRQMIFHATPTMLPHYRELADGMEAFLAKHKPTFRTVEEEATVYLRVNGSGTPQSDEDLARAARIAGNP